MGALYDLQNVSDAYGQNWNDATKLALACDYIDSLKIRDKFVTFLEQAVDEESTDNTFWCAEDEDGAVCFTALGTPLCQRCREAYEAGQARPDAEIIMIEDDLEDGDDHSNDEIIWCALDICDSEASRYAITAGEKFAMCLGCREVFEMGQASPKAAIYDLDQVRVSRGEDGGYTITETLQATANGFEWLPYTPPERTS